ncbi:MAG: hypothetical protein AAGB34_05385 [Planctomycetota bacterium]
MPGGIVFWIMVAVGILSWVLGKVNEQKELREQKERMRRRQEEQARQGQRPMRPAPTENDPRVVVAQRGGVSQGQGKNSEWDEIQRQRRERLRQLRERQTGGARRLPGQPAPDGSGPRSSPPATPRPQPTARQAPQIQQAERQHQLQQRAQRQREAQIDEARRQAAQREELERQQQEAIAQRRREERRRDAEMQEAAAKAERISQQRSHQIHQLLRPDQVGTESHRQRLASLIALSEVLAPPMSARRDEEMPWNRSL